MSEFKVGNEVWWFEYPEQCIGLTKNVVLKNSIICETNDDKYVGVTECHSLHRFDVDLYKTKNEAIDAMIKHLEAMRDD